MTNDTNAERKILDLARADKRESPAAPEARGICEAYGITIPKEGVAQTTEAAAKLAADIGFPVVMKIVSPQIWHKTEAGAVMVRVNGFYYTPGNLCATFCTAYDAKGRAALSSQSGGIGMVIIGFSRSAQMSVWAIVGLDNKSTIDEDDLLTFFEQDNNTTTIAQHLGDLQDGRWFAEVAKRASKKKPVVASLAGAVEEEQAAEYLYHPGTPAYAYSTEIPVAVLGAKYRGARGAGLIPEAWVAAGLNARMMREQIISHAGGGV